MPDLIALGKQGAGTVFNAGLDAASAGFFGPEGVIIADIYKAVRGFVNTSSAGDGAILTGPDSLAVIHGGVSDLQTSVDALPTAEENAAATLDFVYPDEEGSLRVKDMIQIAGSVAYQIANGHAYRHYYGPNFLWFYLDTENIFHADNYPDLRAAWPGANNPGESDLDMLNRVLPDYDWTDTGWPDGPSAFIDANNPAVYVLYSPMVTLSAIRELFAYIPADGGPKRYASTDMCRILSMLPVQWGDVGTGP